MEGIPTPSAKWEGVSQRRDKVSLQQGTRTIER